MYAKYFKSQDIQIISSKKSDIGAKEFFNQLYPDFHLNKNKILIRCIPIVHSKEVKINSKLFRNLDGAIAFAQKWDKEKKYHIFFECPELKSSATNGQQSNVLRYPFLFSDVDPIIKDKSGKIIKTYTKKELREKIYRFKLKPSIIVDSGNGYHFYWLLNTPLYNQDKVSYILSEIQKGLEGDPNAINPTQLLRVPFTQNRKSKKAKLVKIVDFNSKVYTEQELLDTLEIEMDQLVKSSETTKKGTGKVIDFSDFTKQENKVSFDFTKKIAPLNLDNANTHKELLNILKSQNPLKLTNIPETNLGTAFNCCFHNDENPSANIFRKKNGHYIYKCFSCPDHSPLDIIGVFLKDTKTDNYALALIHLSEFYGITGKYVTWLKQQYNKYQSNFTLLDSETETSFLQSKYPNLWRLLNRRSHYLKLLNAFGYKNIKSDIYKHGKDAVFFLSYKHFYEKYSEMHKVTERTAIRAINLFCALGLISKVRFDELDPRIQKNALVQTKNKAAKINKYMTGGYNFNNTTHANFFVVHEFKQRLKLAEQRATKLIKNKFTMRNCVNKEFFILALGDEVANQVYHDERAISKRSMQISRALEKTLVQLIKNKGYTTKDEIVTKTVPAGRLRATKSTKQMVLGKYFSEFLAKYDLVYQRATKSLMDEYGLERSIYIIIQNK